MGTVNTWPSMRTIERVVASAKMAVRIGRTIAVSVPKTRARMNKAAMIPISSLDSVEGLETFKPSCPPVCTSSPAAWAGFAAALMIPWAWLSERAPGFVFSPTVR